MVRRTPLALIALLAACGSDGAPAAPGTMVLEQARRPLPAVARYCARDTMLSVVALDRDWSAAVALRASWPPDSTRRFTIDSALGVTGSASIAARNMRDSSGEALVARSGTVTLDAGSVLAGRFDATTGDSTVPRLSGRFESPAVLLVCP